MQTKRTQREDSAAKATRIIRDRAYRMCGYDKDDPEYQIIVWTLSQVRNELRKASA